MAESIVHGNEIKSLGCDAQKAFNDTDSLAAALVALPEDRYQIVASRSVPDQSFLMEVVGDSLISQDPKESIHSGSLILCEPRATVSPGDIVIANHTRTGQPVARQLIKERGVWFLRAPNPAYPMMEIELTAIVARANEVITSRKLIAG